MVYTCIDWAGFDGRFVSLDFLFMVSLVFGVEDGKGRVEEILER